MLGSLLLALPFLGTAFAQTQVSYTDASGIPFTGIYDSEVDITLGFVFPSSTTGSEFIGELIVPIAQKWAGISLGGGMPNNPLIVAWPNANTIVSSTRFAT
jgi:cellobiose dehydrogenase (acceptor)